MKNNKNSYYITLDDISARSTPGAVKVLEGSSGGKMPNITDSSEVLDIDRHQISSSSPTSSYIYASATSWNTVVLLLVLELLIRFN